jgi:nicotinate-nucleotide adenylyltransferase
MQTDQNVGPNLMAQQRIAIYGGTFDPVHNGHLEIARRVTQLFAIDEFLFLPALLAPHKQAREVSSALHRYAMLALATNRDPRLRISTFELDGAGAQYTVDTLFHFRSRLGGLAELFFVMGADSWAELATWRSWQRLLTLAHLIVVTRPGYEVSALLPGQEEAISVVDVRGVSGQIDSRLLASASPGIFVTDAVMADVSATAARQAARAAHGEDLDQLVPLEVAGYIRKYQLYRNSHET